MKLNKKWLRVMMIIALLVLVTGCTQNIDANGNILAGREITEATKWTLKAGWFDFLLVIPIAKLILWITNMVGNVAIGVIAVTIFVNLLTLPIMIKSTVSNQKMQLIQPEVERIQKKYRGRKDQASQLRMSNEINAIYKKHGVSMWSSFTTFLTLPIMIAMWYAVQRLPIMYTSSFLGINMGVKLWDMVIKFEPIYVILLVIVAIVQYASIEIPNILMRRKPHFRESSQMKSMKMMNYFMVVMFVYFACIMPSAMSIYWITNSVISIARSVYIDAKYGDTMTKKGS